MNKSELIQNIAKNQLYLSKSDIEFAINGIVELMSRELENGGCIYVRGFGTFSVRKRKEMMGRNPRTGESLLLKARHVVNFKAGKELKERVDKLANHQKDNDT